MNSDGMQAATKLFRQQRINFPMTRHLVQPDKRFRNDMERIMRFAAWRRTAMARMFLRVIAQLQVAWRKLLG